MGIANVRLSGKQSILIGAAMIVGVFVIAGVLNKFVPPEQHSSQISAGGTTARIAEPPFANVILHPYDLLKDPYGYKRQTVFLNVVDRPVINEGSLLSYANFSLGMRLNRMIEENTALYDVLGINARFGGSTDDLLGQVAVIVPADTRNLELDRCWKVEPLGTFEGTNAFGGRLQVPVVRFWRYVEETEVRDGPCWWVSYQRRVKKEM